MEDARFGPTGATDRAYGSSSSRTQPEASARRVDGDSGPAWDSGDEGRDGGEGCSRRGLEPTRLTCRTSTLFADGSTCVAKLRAGFPAIVVVLADTTTFHLTDLGLDRVSICGGGRRCSVSCRTSRCCCVSQGVAALAGRTLLSESPSLRSRRCSRIPEQYATALFRAVELPGARISQEAQAPFRRCPCRRTRWTCDVRGRCRLTLLP